MPFSLKPFQLVAHWVPGWTLLVIIFLAAKQNHLGLIGRIEQDWGTSLVLLAIVTAAFVAGELLDALRDIGEWLLDCLPKWKIGWDFIMEMPEEKLRRVEDYFYTYYIFSSNLTLALVVGIIVELFLPLRFPCWAQWGLVIAMLVTLANAITLRLEIVRITAHFLKPHEKTEHQKKPAA
jgi:hypothetical protein